MSAKHGANENAAWTRELGVTLLDGIEDNKQGKQVAEERVKALHPLPQGKDRYPKDFEKWLTKVFEKPSQDGVPPWLSLEFWRDEVDRVLTLGIFGRNVAKDEVVDRIHSVWPKLSCSWLGARMEEVARTGLPRWMDQTFWASEIDPILLSGIQNASQYQHEAVEMVLRAFPQLNVGMIWDRLRRLRKQRTEDVQVMVPGPAAANGSDPRGKSAEGEADSSAPVQDRIALASKMDQMFWRTKVDPILLSGIRNSNRLERETVERVLRRFSELRISAIWGRLRRLRYRHKPIGPLPWTNELDERLRRVNGEAGLSASVSEIQNLTDWPRRAILRHAHKLGLPMQPVSARRRWMMAEVRFVIESVNHLSVREIAADLERSEKAVWSLLGLRGIPGGFEDGYSVRELATKLHVRRPSIRMWIKADLLHRKRNGRISEDSLQTFLYNHSERINWSLLDEDTTYLVSELLEAERIRVSGSGARPSASSRNSEEEQGTGASNSHDTASNRLVADPCEDPVSHRDRARGASPRQ